MRYGGARKRYGIRVVGPSRAVCFGNIEKIFRFRRAAVVIFVRSSSSYFKRYANIRTYFYITLYRIKTNMNCGPYPVFLAYKYDGNTFNKKREKKSSIFPQILVRYE